MIDNDQIKLQWADARGLGQHVSLGQQGRPPPAPGGPQQARLRRCRAPSPHGAPPPDWRTAAWRLTGDLVASADSAEAPRPPRRTRTRCRCRGQPAIGRIRRAMAGESAAVAPARRRSCAAPPTPPRGARLRGWARAAPPQCRRRRRCRRASGGPPAGHNPSGGLAPAQGGSAQARGRAAGPRPRRLALRAGRPGGLGRRAAGRGAFPTGCRAGAV